MAIFHGENDNVVKFSNAQEIVKQWTNVTQSDINNSIETIDFDGITDIKRNDYYNVNAQLMVSKFSIANLGHAVAVNPGDGEKEGGKEGIYGKDKDFFSTYWAADFFNLLP